MNEVTLQITHSVHCNHFSQSLTEIIGGSRGRTRRTPPKDQILSFRHTNFLERNRLGSRRPPTGNPGSATGNDLPYNL